MADWADVVEDTPEDGDLLMRISKAVLALREAQDKRVLAEMELERAKQHERHLSTKIIPDLMAEAGMSKLTTSDGIPIEVSDVVRAAIPKDRKPEAIRYLVDHGHASIVKNDVLVSFDKDNHEAAVALFTKLQRETNSGLVKLDSGVHHSTLTAWVREQIEAGIEVPIDIFGVHQEKQTKLKVKK